MGKGMQVLVWGALAALTAFLAMLLKQKNAAIELAQARLARMEQRMSQLASTPAPSGSETALEAQLAAKTAEVARLQARMVELEAVAADATIVTRYAPITASPLADAPPQVAAEVGWHVKAPGLVAIGQTLAALSPAKLAYANHALQTRIVPEVVAQPQDLTAVEGIGAIYEQRLYNAGIGTYWELAELDDDALREILKLDRVRAAATDLGAIRTAARALAVEQETLGFVWKGEPVDDFEPIKGIGKVYEQRLYDAGIRTYTALAQASPEHLLSICQSNSPVLPDIASWVEQAQKLALQE